MNCINKAELNLIENIRLLWSQHSTWTGAAVTSIVLKTANEEFVVNRLLRNPMDFTIALTPFYGNVYASQFGELLTEHLELAAQLINAIMANESQEAEKLKKEWYNNGNEIAIFLGCINPYWSTEEWRTMFYIHLAYIMKEVCYLMNKQYQQAIDIQDQLELEALEMGDMMAMGIVKQFPYMFCR